MFDEITTLGDDDGDREIDKLERLNRELQWRVVIMYCFGKLAQGHLRTMLAAVERGKKKRNFNDNYFAV